MTGVVALVLLLLGIGAWLWTLDDVRNHERARTRSEVAAEYQVHIEALEKARGLDQAAWAAERRLWQEFVAQDHPSPPRRRWP